MIVSGPVSGTQQNLDESCRLIPIVAGDVQSDLPILTARQVGQPFQALDPDMDLGAKPASLEANDIDLWSGE